MLSTLKAVIALSVYISIMYYSFLAEIHCYYRYNVAVTIFNKDILISALHRGHAWALAENWIDSRFIMQ